MNGKIKEIKGVKPWDGPNGTIYYHAIIMEDGAKLNIGKKKENAFQVGQEIEYEAEPPNEHGWSKAKHITQSFTKGFQKEPFEERAASFALRYAVDFGIAKDLTSTDTLKVADVFNNWLRVNGKVPPPKQ